MKTLFFTLTVCSASLATAMMAPIKSRTRSVDCTQLNSKAKAEYNLKITEKVMGVVIMDASYQVVELPKNHGNPAFISVGFVHGNTYLSQNKRYELVVDGATATISKRGNGPFTKVATCSLETPPPPPPYVMEPSPDNSAPVVTTFPAVFKMDRDPNTQPPAKCDIYTELKLRVEGKKAIVDLVQKIGGTSICTAMIKPNPRQYQLYLTKTQCGSNIYHQIFGEAKTAVLTDNRGGQCGETGPQAPLIILKEFNAQGKPVYLYSRPQ